MELVTTASLMGIRESRRIMGLEKLTLADFIMRAKFPNEIGRYAYPVDAHATKPTPDAYAGYHSKFEQLRYKTGESYGIPYGIIVPQELQNVFVCGRCVSADREMQSSIRVMPGCYITGQAAGAAAFISVNTSSTPTDLDTDLLRSMIISMGGYSQPT